MPSKSFFILFAIIFLFTSQGVRAETGLELVNTLHAAMSRLSEASKKIQDLNHDDKALAGYFQLMQINPNADSLQAAGESITYPPDLKVEYDTAMKAVLRLIDKVLVNASSASSNLTCKEKIKQLEAKVDIIKPSIVKTLGLSVASPKPRAKAYLSIMQNLPLSLVAAEVSMIPLVVCTS